MSIRRNALMTVLLANLTIAIAQKWQTWNRVAVIVSAAAVLINAGMDIAGWVKASEE